jgi:hypothetical protein
MQGRRMSTVTVTVTVTVAMPQILRVKKWSKYDL